MVEMFRYLTGILEKKEQKSCIKFVSFSFLCPVIDIICYSGIIVIINRAVQDNRASEELTLLTLLMCGISVLKFFADLYRCKLSGDFIYKSAQRLSVKLFEVLIKEDLMRHNQKSASQALMIIRYDAENAISIIINCIEIFINGITLMGYSLVLIYVAKWVGAGSSILVILVMVGILSFYRKQAQIYGEKYRASGIKLNAQVTTSYGVFKEMKISSKEDFLLERYGEISRKHMHIQREYGYKAGVIGIFMNNAVLVVIFIVLSFFLIFGGDSLSYILGLAISYITMLIKIVSISYNTVNRINTVEFSKNSYEAFRQEYEQYERLKEQEKIAADVRQKKIDLKKGITVKNLTFSYDGRNPIFEDASLDIPVGHSIAITGVSGVGKTTFLDLVLGLLKPQTGSICYDDYDIVTQTDKKGKCTANIGEIVSYIPQTIYLNGETIRNNVAFFEDGNVIDDQKVRKALECALVWGDVSNMPEGIHTLIGENGTTISGGQRQRIALARALYKDFEILIMDEATTALDMETEMAVIDSIRQVKGNKTILMVTHHMSLAKECDLIYSIENKKMIRVK